MSLPPIHFLRDSGSHDALYQALVLLLESSPPLKSLLVPEVAERISKSTPSNYEELIQICLETVSAWPTDSQAEFVNSHPRIGEIKGLSELSAAEQAAKSTSPEVLSQLESLNHQYEIIFPKLRFITWVRGRSRAVVAEDMRSHIDTFLVKGKSFDIGSPEWNEELERNLKSIWSIAFDRLTKMQIQGQVKVIM